MDQNSRHPERLITFSDGALLDLANLDNMTAHLWGPAQADRYVAFLSATFRELAANPHLGKAIPERSPFRPYLAKFRKSRWANGHRIIYQEEPKGIMILRILHSRMNLTDHLD